MLAAALGITAVVVRIPHALTLLAAGALYLAGWPGSRCGRAGVRRLTSSRVNAVQSRRLLMGATTSLLNQADDDLCFTGAALCRLPAGNVLAQTLMLGSMLIIGFATSNGLVALFAGSLSAFMTRRRRLLLLQRMLTGCVLAILSLRMLQDVLPAGLLVDLLMLGQPV
jgi:threonine/homoserine/homoserine lactone efflux protein